MAEPCIGDGHDGSEDGLAPKMDTVDARVGELDTAESAEDAGETMDAAELKALGNAAYQSDDVAVAVHYWNRALRKHVEDMRVDSVGLNPLAPESKALELALYLNLAQGYLKLGDPSRALRACQVVMLDNPNHPKATCRAAEACMTLGRESEAIKCLKRLLEAEPSNLDARRQLQRIKALRHEETNRQKDVAKRMCEGTTGYSEGRKQPTQHLPKEGIRNIVRGIHDVAPETLERSLTIADEAKRAALDREARRHAATLPTPSTLDCDFETFRAKARGRSQKYGDFIAKTKQRQSAAQHSVKLAWLRTGREDAAYDAFEGSFRDELQVVAATAAAAAQAGADATAKDSQSGLLGEALSEVLEIGAQVTPEIETHLVANGFAMEAMD